MSRGAGGPQPAESRGKGTSKSEARRGLDRLQKSIGVLLLLSAATSAYLLATDNSLWLLALSHAFGLMMLLAIDLALGVLNLLSRRSVFLPSVAAAILGILLQLGDILTAPQYSQTVYHFASYLFGLGAFDLLLGFQGAVIAASVYGRGHAVRLARMKSRRGKELDYTKRSFVRSIAAFTGLVGLAALVSSIKFPTPGSTRTQTTTIGSGLPGGAVANVNKMRAGTPVYFDYPSGYPNILTLRSDGSLEAVSLLCTHVCCTCYYDSASKEIYCPCHGSLFDTAGEVLNGPANIPLPSVSLTVDQNGNVFPTGVSDPGPCQV